MRKIRQLGSQLLNPSYRWLFLFNSLGLILTLLVTWMNGTLLPLAMTIAIVNLIIILIQASISAYWKRSMPIHRRTDDPEL